MRFRTLPLVRSFSLIAIILFLSSCSTAKPPDVPFELLYGISLSNDDKTDIVGIAQRTLNKPIQKVSVNPALPASTPVVVVVTYEHELLGSYVIETKLRIYEKNPRNSKKEFLDSLTISRGRWGSKPALLQSEALRSFTIDEVKINLSVPDGMSYVEMRRLLEAVKSYQIIWEDPRPTIKEFAIQEIARVTLEGPERLYVLSIVKQGPPFYFVYARFEEGRLVVKRTNEAIP